LRQLRELLARGPGAPRRRSRILDPLLRWLRRLLLKAIQPYSYYQHEVDSLLLQYLTRLDRSRRDQRERLERLEELVGELITACDAIRRYAEARGDDVAEQAAAALEEAREARRVLLSLRDEPNRDTPSAAPSSPASQR